MPGRLRIGVRHGVVDPLVHGQHLVAPASSSDGWWAATVRRRFAVHDVRTV
jgi:hypothetical protein